MIYPDLLAAQKLLYEPNGWLLTKLEKEEESEEYGACSFELNGCRTRFRVGKITPTKVGHFVTFWKRSGWGPILPYDWEDPVELLIVSVRKGEKFGQFIFPKEVLSEKGIVSKEGRGGKLGFRLYAPWEQPNNRQAAKTQAWQRLYFLEIEPCFEMSKTFLFTV